MTFVAASETVRQRVTELGLDDMITVHGVVSREEMRTHFYPQSDIFLLPSHGEGFPNSLLEAMAAGLPVVTCPVGAIPEVVQPGVHGFLNPPGDADALARDVLTLANDPALRARRRAGRRRG